MSNTDGEDTQKVSLGELLLNAGTRIVDLEKQSNDQVEIITHLDQELASLREQLATEQDMRSTAEFANRMIIKDLNEKLKQKEDENRELLDSISQLIYAMNTTGLPWNTDSTAEKAYANCRSLLKKHIG